MADDQSRNPKYLRWLRTLPCLICGDPTSTEAAHVRYSEYKSGKINPGKGAKPSDLWALNLCSYHHAMQHTVGEREFWKQFQINPITYCVLLHQNRYDINKLEEVIEKSRIKQDRTIRPLQRYW